MDSSNGRHQLYRSLMYTKWARLRRCGPDRPAFRVRSAPLNPAPGTSRASGRSSHPPSAENLQNAPSRERARPRNLRADPFFGPPKPDLQSSMTGPSGSKTQQSNPLGTKWRPKRLETLRAEALSADDQPGESAERTIPGNEHVRGIYEQTHFLEGQKLPLRSSATEPAEALAARCLPGRGKSL